MINPFYLELVGVVVRWLMTSLSGYLVAHHILTADQTETLTNDLVQHAMLIAPAVVAIAWSVLAKYRSRIKFLTALELPAGTTEARVEARITNGTGATLTAIGLLLLLPSAVQAQPSTPTLDALIKEIAALKAGSPTPLPVPPTVVPPGGDVQAAIDAAPVGGTVYLTAGATYTQSLVFRQRGSVTLTTAGFPVPAGTRVGPADAPSMATIVCGDCFLPTIGFELGAHDVKIVGVRVNGNPTHPDRITVSVGLNPTTWANPTTRAELVHDVTLDRVYIPGDPVGGGHTGVRLDGINLTVINSDIRDFREIGRDSQAIAIYQGPGPFLIDNNYLEATGENFIVGGDDPAIQNLVPSDITFTHNRVFKPLAWKTTAVGSVKNLFELKNARRVRVEFNTFENNWADAQPGHGIVLTVRNQNGGCPWCVVADVIIRNNVVTNVEQFAVNILGMDDTHPSGTASNLQIVNNLFNGASKGVQVQGPLTGLEVGHNTFLGVTGQFLAIWSGPVTGLNIHDNVTAGGAYGITGDGSLGLGIASLAAAAPGAVFTHNLIEGTAERTIRYPAGNYLLAPGALASKLDARYAVSDATYVAADGSRVGVDVSVLPKP